TRGRTACLCHRMLSYKKLGLSATEQDGKYLLLASSNSLLRALTGTCVVFGALTADWQTTAVAQTLVGANFNFATNICRNFTAEVTFNPKVAFDVVAQFDEFVIRKIFNARICVNTGFVQDLDRAAFANTINVGESDDDTFFTWNINAC